MYQSDEELTEALAALDKELRGVGRVRLASRDPAPARPAPNPELTGGKAPYMKWKLLGRWVMAHPGVEIIMEDVPKNAPWRLCQHYPLIKSEGRNHRRNPETGKQVCTLHAWYDGPPSLEEDVAEDWRRVVRSKGRDA